LPPPSDSGPTLPDMSVRERKRHRHHGYHHPRATWFSTLWVGLCALSLVSCVGAQGQIADAGDTTELFDSIPAGVESLEGGNSDGPDGGLSGDEQPTAREETTTRQGATPAIETPSRSEATPQAAAAVSQYLALTDEVGATGGVAVDAMADGVTPEWLAVEERGFADYRERRIKTLGHTEFFALSVQSVRWSPHNMWEVAAFACIDSRRVWVVPADSPDTPEGLVEWLASTSTGGDGKTTLSESGGVGEAVDPVADSPTEADLALWQEFIDEANPDAGPLEPVLLWLVGSELDQLKVDATQTWRGYHPCGTDNPVG